MAGTDSAANGVPARGRFNQAILALCDATLLPQAVAMRPPRPQGVLGVERRGSYPREKSCEKDLLNDEVRQRAIAPHRRDGGGNERPELIDALKIDAEGFEDFILRPFFLDANARLWPRLVIMEDAGSAAANARYSLASRCR